MKLGAYTACLHDRSLPEALKILRELGLTSAEINAGGFIPAPHLPVGQLLSGDISPADYLGQLEQAGITLTGLNVNGNPLNPDPEVGPKHAEDLRRAITIATLERLVTEINATHVGAEMDPSHLFWQGIDPVTAIEYLGDLVYHAAAKDTRINEQNCRVYGVLDDRFQRVPAEENPLGLGGKNTLTRWPADASWQFVAVGRGHDQEFWARFLRALSAVDPGIAVNIEHEDTELDQIEGLRLAAENLT